jgi:hypothetical protein
VIYLVSFASRQNSPKNTGLIQELSYMPALTLSTGVTFQTEAIRCAEYYPCGSLLNKVSVSRIWVPHEKDFLFIRTAKGSTHVCGCGAAQDATALEEAGVRVNRRPLPAALPPSRGIWYRRSFRRPS